MNNTVKTILAIVLIAAVLVVASLVTGKKSVESITLDEYKTISSSDGFVYYGTNDDMDQVKQLAKDYDLKISFLDSKENKNNDLKNGTLYEYKDGEEVFKYTGDFNSYKFTESLMKRGIAIKSYVTVTLDEYKKLIKEDGYHFMFIGRETCGYCTKFKESIKEAMKDHDFMVYYIDTDTFTSEDEFNDLVATDRYMSEEEWGTPLNLLYKDGKRIDVLNGYVPASELIAFLQKNKVVK